MTILREIAKGYKTGEEAKSISNAYFEKSGKTYCICVSQEAAQTAAPSTQASM